MGDDFAGAVLTGGRSTRMGRDKALLVVGGRPPLCVVAADALRAAGAASVLAIGGDLDALAALGLDAVPDDHPDEGPLGGLLTALGRPGADPLVVLACDMPDVDGPTVRVLLDALAAAPAADAAVAVAGGRAQPLTAAYRRRCLPRLRAAFEDGERSVRAASAGLTVVEVPGLADHRLADVDEPTDLRRYAHPS
jgi:molybdopterin-guanine dinucleotide biosynthesis protein A